MTSVFPSTLGEVSLIISSIGKDKEKQIHSENWQSVLWPRIFLGTLVFPREIEDDIEQRVHFCKVPVLFGLGAVSG